jgi:hypothetical protein
MTPSVCANLSLKVWEPSIGLGAVLPVRDPCSGPHAFRSRVCGAVFPGGGFGGGAFCAAPGRLAPSNNIRTAAHRDRLSVILSFS